MSWPAVVLFWSALLSLTARDARAAGSMNCYWRALSVRDATPADSSLELGLPYARVDDAQLVLPGPDSLRLVGETDADHHPHVLLEDQRTAKRKPLVEGWASWPSWSPDGKFAACLLWVSQSQPRQLVLVDRRGHVTRVDSVLVVTEFKWSPDARGLAVYGSRRSDGASTLVYYNVETRRSNRVDRTTAFADYTFSWSPDSKYLVFSRPTATGPHDEVTAADLWIAPRSGGHACPLLQSKDVVESNPVWVGPWSIRFEEESRASAGLGRGRLRVVDIGPAR